MCWGCVLAHAAFMPSATHLRQKHGRLFFSHTIAASITHRWVTSLKLFRNFSQQSHDSLESIKGVSIAQKEMILGKVFRSVVTFGNMIHAMAEQYSLV